MIRLRKLLLPAAILLFVWAIVAAVTGGVDARIAGISIRARGAFRPLLLALALGCVHVAGNRGAWTAWIATAGAALNSASRVIAVLAMAGVTFHAVWFSPRVAGGSDSYGYVSEAYGWLTRDLPRPYPLLSLPFHASDWLQIPLGHRPGPQPATMVPTYAPGLPLLMAAAAAVAGRYGIFLVVPLSAALLVWAVWDWARRAAGEAAGVVAALAASTSPIVLYQAIAPMSDVPAGALWAGAAALALHDSIATAFMSGVLAAGGVLVRPNLLPLAAVPFVAAVVSRGNRRILAALTFVLPVVVAVAFVAWLNTIWYGGPLHSGYGAAGDIYKWANVRANLLRYPRWFLESQSAWAFIGVLPVLPLFVRHARRTPVLLAVATITGTLVCYLPYEPFDAWWYLRFLLPAMGAAAVMIGVGAVSLGRTVPQPWGGFVAVAIVIVMIDSTLSFAASNSTFGPLRDSERRYAYIGAFVARALPDNAVVFAVQHSGSVRLYGGRYTLRYDALDEDGAGEILQRLTRAGLHPFLVADEGELEDVRRHFHLASGASFPWPIFARMRELGGVNVFDLTGDPRTANPTALEPGGVDWCPAILPLKPPVFRPAR